jgi:putative cell wall-binding protein/sugar lactone lactonase YvrE
MSQIRRFIVRRPWSVPAIVLAISVALAVSISLSASAATLSGNVIKLAGVGTTGAGGTVQTTATTATALFNGPAGGAVDATGNVFVTEHENNGIRKISGGTVTLFAGSTARTAGGTNGTGTGATLSGPQGAACDAAGNIFVVETGGNRIRKITQAGVVTNFAGSTAGNAGNAVGAAATARFSAPYQICIDATGTYMYVADTTNNRIRRIRMSDGFVTNYAGTGATTAAVNNVTTTTATFSGPMGVACDAAGNVYVSDTGHNMIRKISPAGLVTFFAGSGSATPISNGATATSTFSAPRHIVLSPDATALYVADYGNNQIRAISGGTVSLLAGSPTGAIGNANGLGSAASFNQVRGLFSDSAGNLYAGEHLGNYDVRKILVSSGFTIVPSAGVGGSISPNTTQTVSPGADSATFAISPSLGYHIADVTVDGISQGAVTSYQFTSVGANHTINATFAIDTLAIDPSAGPGGSISPSVRQMVDYGSDSATFTIDASLHYHVVDVIVDGTPQGPRTAYKFTDVTVPHTIAAVFAIDSYTITPVAGEHGSITPTQSIVPWSNDVTFDISADEHYHVVDVSVDGDSIGASSSVTFADVTGPHTLSATFAIDTYTITPDPGAHGSMMPSTPTQAVWGSDQTVVISPDEGYHIADTMVDGESIGASSSVLFEGIDESHTVSATFAIDTFEIVPTAGDHGTISPATTQTVEYGSDSATFVFQPEVGYHVAHVYLDGVQYGPASEYQFANVTQGHTISVEFSIDRFLLVPEALANGFISPDRGFDVDYGSDATFTMRPDAHYHVSDVVVDSTSVGNPTVYTLRNITASHMIFAYFAKDMYAIEPSAGSGGSISPSTTETVAYGSDSSTFTIAPDAHHHITNVEVDGVSQGAITEWKFTGVDASHTIQATFAPDEYTITPTAGANGSISPSTTQTVTLGGSSPVFTVTPATGYHIADVLVDGSTIGALGSYQFTDVSDNHTISATFGLTKTIPRLSGKNRYVTAIDIARNVYPGWAGVKHLVLASGDYGHQPDALCAAGLAGAYDAPLLLVPSNSLDPDVKAAIQAMPSGVQVHIVGGTPSVSNDVAHKIGALSKVKSVDRLSGSDRYGTSAAVARKMQSVLKADFPITAMITSGGDSLLDPLVASTVSVSKHYPVLLVARESVPSVTDKALNDLKLSERYIVGNSSSVSEGVRTALAVDTGDRISGVDVREDAVAFATRAKAEGWLGNATAGFAAAVPDAATGGAFMGKKNGPMLLVTSASVPASTSNYLTANKADIQGGFLFGGAPTVAESVRLSLQGLLN